MDWEILIQTSNKLQTRPQPHTHYLLTTKKWRLFCDVGETRSSLARLGIPTPSQSTKNLIDQGLNPEKSTSSGDHPVFPPPTPPHQAFGNKARTVFPTLSGLRHLSGENGLTPWKT